MIFDHHLLQWGNAAAVMGTLAVGRDLFNLFDLECMCCDHHANECWVFSFSDIISLYYYTQ